MSRTAFKRNREAWLAELAMALRPRFTELGMNLEIPTETRLSCGWPSKHATSRKTRRVGECWMAEASQADRPEIFISPTLADPVEVAAVVVHELIHAALPKAGHGPKFRRVAVELGLEGRMTATVPGDQLRSALADLVGRLGAYPHAAIVPADGSKQTTRLRKVVCSECGYTVRVTAKWIDVGLPTCPCGNPMEEVDTGDE